MSHLTPKQIAALAAAVAAVSAVSAEARTLDQARNQVSSVMAGKVELLERSENPSIPQATVDKLQAELQSCGIADTGPRCLDGSAFADYGPLRGEASKNNYIATSEGWVFFSRFQVKNNARKENPYLVMAVRARKADTMPAFISGTIYAIPAGHESQDVIKKDFQQCMAALASPTNTAVVCPLNGFLAYEAMTDQGALEVLGGNADANDFRRFFHAAEVAFAVRNPKPSYVAAVTRAIKARYSIVTDSGNDKYATAFTNLLGAASKTASYKTLASDIVSDMFDKADRGSQNELAIAIQMAAQGIPNDRIEAVLVNGFRTPSCGTRVRGACFPEDQRRAAVAAYAQAAVDKDAFIALLGDDDSLVRSQAYFTVRDKKVVLTNDNLDAIQALIDSPKVNVRGNVIAALSQIDTDEASVLLAITVQDKDVDVATAAYNKVEPRVI